MSIPDEDVAQVRAATDIVALIGEHTALRKSGRRWSGLCPFHAEKTPSFSVNAEDGFYYCFGCHASGDAITFVRNTEHLDFVDAVRFLAERAGIVIHEDAAGGVDRKRKDELYDAMERAVTWYHERLLSAPDAGPARDYLRSRGYDGEIVRRFRLGWAPDDWDALTRALDLPQRVATDSGLGFVNRAGRAQDAFRARVMFPICDPSGKPVALGGRILPPPPGRTPRAEANRRPEPKYKNSIETPIYSKRRTLYALNWAKTDIIASGEVVVCEGYTDVIGCFVAGIERAVATCGTALAEEHFRLLRNYSSRIVFAFDADSAGQSAISRVYEWERRHEVEVAVAAFPPGSDPAELARTDPELLRKAIDEAKPFLQFRVDRVQAAADLATPEGRARAAAAALEAVAEHPDDLVRDQYVMQIAGWSRLDPEPLRARLERARAELSSRRPEQRGAVHTTRAPRARPSESAGGSRVVSDGPATPHEPERTWAEVWDDAAPDAATDGPPRGTAAPDDSARRAEPDDRPGLEALRLTVHRPDDVVDRLDEVLFVEGVLREAFVALITNDSLHDAVEQAGPSVAHLLRRISVEEPVAVDNPLVDPIDAVVAQLVRAAVRRALADLEHAVRTSAADLAHVAGETAQVRRWVLDLDDPELGRGAEVRLVAWLAGRDPHDA